VQLETPEKTSDVLRKRVDVMLDTKSSESGRASILRDDLQAAIVAGVRGTDPACEPFIGVVIERIDSAVASKANWTIKGVKYGKADRTKADSVLATIVERMQKEYDLAHRQPARSEKSSKVSLWQPPHTQQGK
jgi:hypothetical protein